MVVELRSTPIKCPSTRSAAPTSFAIPSGEIACSFYVLHNSRPHVTLRNRLFSLVTRGGGSNRADDPRPSAKGPLNFTGERNVRE